MASTALQPQPQTPAYNTAHYAASAADEEVLAETVTYKGTVSSDMVVPRRVKLYAGELVSGTPRVLGVQATVHVHK